MDHSGSYGTLYGADPLEVTPPNAGGVVQDEATVNLSSHQLQHCTNITSITVQGVGPSVWLVLKLIACHARGKENYPLSNEKVCLMSLVDVLYTSLSLEFKSFFLSTNKSV